MASSTSTTATAISAVAFGTGHDLYRTTLLPALEAAQHEVILITCFWAASPTLSALGASLRALNQRAVEGGRRVRVRIGFSSTSVAQKLLSRGGRPRAYSGREWQELLGLPGELAEWAGLEVSVTSVFFLPFSVWHPKFVIVDRRTVFLPSCNVSWEEWFEVCVSFRGPIVQEFVKFWTSHWHDDAGPNAATVMDELLIDSDGENAQDSVKCLFLPSPHCRNPHFRLPWQAHAAPPQTPLNMKLLELFATAREGISIQTPNLTSPPVLEGLINAVRRGVNVHIVTSARLMILEQLVTAGTTTDRCVRRFIKTYQTLAKPKPSGHDVEQGLLPPGRLQIAYYQPRPGVADEPVQSHAKLTIVDREVVVFGSGNMDRASWYTSQELGVAVYSKSLVAAVMGKLEQERSGRTHAVFDSVAQ